MKSRDHGDKRKCECCGSLTMFVFSVRTPRGRHVRFADCCVSCGEMPELTSKLTPERKGVK